MPIINVPNITAVSGMKYNNVIYYMYMYGFKCHMSFYVQLSGKYGI